MVPFRSQDVGSHPWVGGGLGGILSVTVWAIRSIRGLRTPPYWNLIDWLILPCKLCWVTLRILNKCFTSALKAAVYIACNSRYLIVYDTVQLLFVGIFKSATSKRWSQILSDVDKERTLHHREGVTRSKDWPGMWAGRLTYLFKSKDSKIPVRCLTSIDNEST